MTESRIFRSLIFSTILLTSGIAGSIQSVSASEGYFENDYGKQVSQSPTVCLFQPDNYKIDETTWKIWYADAKRGIDTWRSVLEQSGSGEWKIDVREVPLNKLDLLNWNVCDITVEFVDKPYIQDGKYANALGWWNVDTGITKIVYSSFQYCGREYDVEFNIFVNTICFGDKFERSRYMASVVQHEFGHALGLGHYIGYDDSFTQNWYDTGKGYPSIMTPMPPNEDMKTITQEDVQRIRQIYGDKGFGKKTNFTPLFNERIIEKPIITSSQSTHLTLSGTSPITKMIQGNVPDKLFKRGMYLELIIDRPDGTTDHQALAVAKTLKSYKTQLTFGSSDPTGTYHIAHSFNGEIFHREEITISKDSSKNIPKTYPKSTSNNDQDNDGIVDTKDLCNTKPETHNGYKDADGCPDDYPSRDSDGDGIQDKDDKCPKIFGVKEKMGCKIPTPISEEQISDNLQKISYDEIAKLQKESYEKLNSFKKEMQSMEESLEKLSSDSEEQKEKINQAWNMLRDSEKNMEFFEGRIKGGDNHIGYGNYETAKTFFANEQIVENLDENIKKISKTIEQTQKTQPQTCFLFWCW